MFNLKIHDNGMYNLSKRDADLSKRVEMERTCLENRRLNKFIDYDNQDIFILLPYEKS